MKEGQGRHCLGITCGSWRGSVSAGPSLLKVLPELGVTIIAQRSPWKGEPRQSRVWKPLAAHVRMLVGFSSCVILDGPGAVLSCCHYTEDKDGLGTAV